MRMSKQCVIFSLLILSICYDESVAEDSPCGDWVPYKDEKCFKIFEKVELQTYEDAEKTCQKQENGSSLITIDFLEEQEFVSNLFKAHKVVNDVWIGVKYNNNKYKWNDDSDLVFTNWAQGSPKNKTGHCAQMNSDETLFGKWWDILCNKMNIVVCQKMQTWSLSHLQKLLLNTIKNPFPIGFIYVQLSNEKSPTEIWPWITWKDITSAYAGLFFRAEGGGSEKFGNVQCDDSPRLIKVRDVDTECVRSVASIVPGTWSSAVAAGKNECGKIIGLEFMLSSVEVRPRNMAIRIWKRTG